MFTPGIILSCFGLRHVDNGVRKRYTITIEGHDSERDTLMQTVTVPASKPGQSYYVRTYNDGSMTCSCSDFLFRRKPAGEVCKHIRGVITMQPTATPAAPRKRTLAEINELLYGA